MEKIDILWNIEQIKQLKARYFRFVDAKNNDAYCDVFTKDVEFLWLDENAQIVKAVHGREKMRAWLDELDESRITVHCGHMPEIEICDENNATGIWAMMDYVEVPGVFNFKGYGHYHEKYLKQDGEWRIGEIRITRLRMDHQQ